MNTRAENLLETLYTVIGVTPMNEGIFGRPEQYEIDRLSNEIRVQLKEAVKKNKDKFFQLVSEHRLLPYESSISETLGSSSSIDSFVERSLRMSSLVHVRDFHDKCCFLLGQI
jgi:hypothetical protein